MQLKRSGEMLTLGNLPVATLKCSALPSPQTSSVCLPRPLCHLCMGTPSAASKTQVSGTGTCGSPAVSPSRSIPPSTHTHCSTFWPRVPPQLPCTCLLPLQRNYSTELSLLLVPTLSPTRSLNSLQSDFYTPTLPSSLTYMWTLIVCPTLF